MHDATETDWEWILRVNLHGVINGVRAFLPHMRAAGRPAHIVNTSSGAGMTTKGSQFGVYTVSKFAVVAYSEVLREELEPEEIGVSVLCPGLVRTRIFEADRNRPEELASEQPNWRGTFKPDLNTGMDPMEVGRLVAESVKANRPYIFPAPEIRARIEERFQAILASFDPVSG
jgi:NAD(P)-dependent dehydrogenase (short-subunit alcohol dehydrogenase family)